MKTKIFPGKGKMVKTRIRGEKNLTPFIEEFSGGITLERKEKK